jgi:2-methylcitrate dehydratase PrpD
MAKTIVEQLAEGAANCSYEDLGAKTAGESKRIILDSIGCGLAAIGEPKGKTGIAIARMMGGAMDEATILGAGERGSVFGAAFANGELINALDFDAVLPPGHVAPYVIPAALAMAESRGASGADVVVAIALAHEMSHRLGKAMDYLRDIKDGKVESPKILGYSCTIFGATAAVLRVKRQSAEVIAHALGIAGDIAPVNSLKSWAHHTPSTSVKYTPVGPLVQSALIAAALAEGGHRGDLPVLDDAEYGYPKFIGTQRWEPSRIATEFGRTWNFPAESSIKPYPHCRAQHGLFDALTAVIEKDNIRPEEIESIRTYGEGFAQGDVVWLNRRIERVEDGQMSLPHGLAMLAHRVPLGKEWQDPAIVFSPSVIGLMSKVTHSVHPDYVERLRQHPASRPTRVEVTARGKVFVGESNFPKGSPSPDPSSYMTDDELAAKFRHNAQGVMSPAAVEDAIDAVMNLEKARDFGAVMRLFAATTKVKLAS